MGYLHNNQRLGHHKVSVHQSDFFACYERCDSTAPFQADRPVTDVAQGWVANVPMLVPSEAAGSTTLVSVGDVTGSARIDASPSFENTGDLCSSSEEGVVAAVKMTGLSLLIWTLFNRLVAGTRRTCAIHIV